MSPGEADRAVSLETLPETSAVTRSAERKRKKKIEAGFLHSPVFSESIRTHLLQKYTTAEALTLLLPS